MGAAVADMVLDQPTRFDVAVLDPQRFGNLPLQPAA
jgi:hypothetical protein